VIYRYLSERSRSFWAKPLTANLFFTKFRIATKHIRNEQWGVSTVAFAIAVCAALLSSCAVQEPSKAPVVVAPEVPSPKPVALSEEADSALKAAEQSVTEARIKRALWTAAVLELDRARVAAKTFDSAATLAHAREAIALCGLSITQLSSAPVKW
jgi:hypothetical protein